MIEIQHCDRPAMWAIEDETLLKEMAKGPTDLLRTRANHSSQFLTRFADNLLSVSPSNLRQLMREAAAHVVKRKLSNKTTLVHNTLSQKTRE